MNIDIIKVACILSFLSVAVYFDIKERRIPNWLIIGMLIVAIPVQVQRESIWAWTAGILVGFALFIPGYLSKQMGAGDVKLMAAVGAFFGAGAAFKIGLSAYLIGGGYALVWMVFQRDASAWWQYFKWRLRVALLLTATMSANPLEDHGWSKFKPRTAAMPYSLPIAAATVFALLMKW